jgi:hypothetical protein
MSGATLDSGVEPGRAPPALQMRFGDRRVLALRVQELSLNLAGCSCHAFAALGLTMRDRHDGADRALFIPLSAAAARELAANLLETADMLDSGKGKQ